MSVIEEIKARVDLVNVVERYTPLRKAGSIYKGLCPFHTERTPSFVVYPHSQSWRCFGACATGGDVFSFLQKKENLEFRDVLEMLARETGVSLVSDEEDVQRGQREALFKVNAAAAEYFREVLLHHAGAEAARAYLQRRGVDAATSDAFGLGYGLDQWSALRDHLLARGFSLDLQLAAGLVKRSEERETVYDSFRGRVIFPIRDRQGRTIGFGGRVLDDGIPKYLNTAETPVFHKSHVIYGFDLAHEAIRSLDQVVIVEGYMDVVAAHQHGFPNVVACMGTALTPEQLRQMQRLTGSIVLALDADAAGQAATVRGLNQARQALGRVNKPTVLAGGRMTMTERLGARIAIVGMPEGMDPDDVVRREPELWRRLVAEARPLVDFFFDSVSHRVDLRTAEGKASAVSELAPLIAELENEVERQHYTHQLSRLAQVDEMVIEGQVRAALTRAPGLRRGDPVHRRDATEVVPPPEDADGTPQGGMSVATGAAVRRAVNERLGAEDHVLAILMREPDLLMWLTAALEEVGIGPLSAQDLERLENQEILRELVRFMTSAQPWDFEMFQESLAEVLHPRLATLAAYGAGLPQRSELELREGMIKDIVHLRLVRLKAESLAVKFLVDDAQRNGELETARSLGGVYARIQRELDHLQRIRLQGKPKQRSHGVATG
jgi:DNA primase